MSEQMVINEAQQFEKPEQALTTMEIIQFAVQHGAAIDVIERLQAMRQREIDRQAQKEFSDAMQLAQREIPPIVANKEVKNGQKLMFKYASYEQLDKQIRPIYLRYGLSVSFNGAEAPAGKVRVLARVTHSGGHAEDYQIDLAIDPGRVGLSQTDAELAAQSKAKRRLLRNIFNIVDDAEDEALSNGWLLERIEWIENTRSRDELTRIFNDAFKEAKTNKAANAMLSLVEARDKKAKEF